MLANSVIYHLASSETSDELFKRADGTYLPIHDGKIGHVLIGHEYFVVSSEFLEILKKCGATEFEYMPVDIVRQDGNKDTGYFSLYTENELVSTDTECMSFGGCKFMLYGTRDIFVTEDLKSSLDQYGVPYILFSKGFTKFAGIGG